jgi:hypothetical protein
MYVKILRIIKGMQIVSNQPVTDSAKYSPSGMPEDAELARKFPIIYGTLIFSTIFTKIKISSYPHQLNPIPTGIIRPHILIIIY